MLTDRAEFDAMLARSQERLHAAIGAAREALGPNAPHEGPGGFSPGPLDAVVGPQTNG